MEKRMKKTLVLCFACSLATFMTIAISVSAAKSQMRRYINVPRTVGTQQLPFSNAVLVGDTLYLGGRIGIDPKTGKPPADAEQEARLVLDSIQATLKEAGM